MKHPQLKDIIAGKEVFWINPRYSNCASVRNKVMLSEIDVRNAEEDLKRFAPYISRVFPETAATGGIIESLLIRIPAMQRSMTETFGEDILGTLLLKCDSHLAVAGSIKARGGIYAVLKHAERLACRYSLIKKDGDYTELDSAACRKLFSHYSIAVSSTGNLGLSIGIMGAQLGFRVTVHMSSDAKQWKKDLLHKKGVVVIEHHSDYSQAVEEGRKQAKSDPRMYFIDDENSKDLFLGYAVAALRLPRQLKELNICVDKEHPLFVYLPCGVGGAPGGITFGLKQIFKDAVHCFFVEPTHSPCMLLGLITGLHNQVSVGDFGLDNVTDADGLAVGRASGFVGKLMEQMVSGIYTVQDKVLYRLLRLLYDTEKIKLEPSALAGMPGAYKFCTFGRNYLDARALHKKKPKANHIVWATGGNMVPPDVWEEYYRRSATPYFR